ncbi:MAG: phosphorylated adapter RNA export RNA-binding domain-containing protein [Caldilineaceae bacterium]
MTLQEIAEQLHEENIELLKQVVDVLGEERAGEYAQRALATEAEGGLMTADGQRRRTPGGVFFYLVKAEISPEERQQIWTKGSGGGQAQSAIQPISWEEAKRLVVAIIQTPGKGANVKLTIVGRPRKVAKAGEGAVVVSLQGKPPGALPKGLPVPPEAGITWAVFIATKQWNKIKESITSNVEDVLIVEGYPMVDKNGVGIVLATNVRSKMQDSASRNAPKQ